ncbi:MAG: two-component regulator propeller domain-containing protein [Bacteroidia bacterium]
MKSSLQTFIVIFLFFTQLKGQQLEPNFHHLNSLNGLSSGMTTCLMKDSRGFLWIGTNAGLNRFDGSNVVRYIHQIGDSTSIFNNDINSICEDSKNRIWIGTDGGLSILDPSTNKFLNYTSANCNGQKIEFNTGVVSVTMFKNKMWFGTLQNILSVSIDSIRFDVLSNEALYDSIKTLRCLPNRFFVTKSGLWMSTWAGMIFTEDGKVFCNKEYNPKHWPILNQPYIMAFYNDGDSVAYYLTWRYTGVYKFRYGSDHLDSIPLLNDPHPSGISYLSLCRSSNNELWATTFGRGIVSVNIKTGDARFYGPDRNNPQAVSDKGATHLLRDEQGTIFIATNRGIDYVNPIQTQFKTYYNKKVIENFLLDDASETFIEGDSGKIWIGTLSKGLFGLNPSTGEMEHFTFPGDYNQVSALYYENNKLLMGTTGGLARFETITKKFIPLKKELPEKVQELTEIITMSIIKDKNENFWIGVWGNGYLKYNFKTKEYIHYSKEDSLHPLIKNSQGSTCASLDKQGRLWLGYTTNDLSCINTSDNSIFNFKLPENKDSSNNSWIAALLNDDKGSLWISSLQGGLYKYHIASKQFTHYDSRNGLSSNALGALLFDKQSNLWINADNGLNKFDLSTEKTVVYNFSDGLPSNQFTYTSSLLTSDGTIYSGCDNYLVSFRPDQLKTNGNLPKVVLVSYKKSGDSFIIKPTDKQLSFNYRDNAVTFEFVGINFIDPDKTRFAYMLDGFDKGWNYNDARTFATYTNLPGGDYLLRYKATNKPDQWNVPVSEIKIHVDGPFWKTWWFFVLCLFTTGLISFLIYYTRLEQILTLQRVRNKIASDLHDDIGSGLSSISVFIEILRKRTGNKEEDIGPFLEKIDTTTRSMSEAIHDIVWTINPKNDKLGDVLARMKNFATELFTVKSIKLNFDCSNEIIAHKLRMEQRKNFYLIFKEAVNNISKYAHATSVLISIHLVENQMRLAIQDNGVGFDINNINEGNGLKNMKRRAEELGGNLNINSRPGEGTSLLLNFKAA